jgi:hypothetical protein
LNLNLFSGEDLDLDLSSFEKDFLIVCRWPNFRHLKHRLFFLIKSLRSSRLAFLSAKQEPVS